jgi:hypothetical protein
MALAGVLLAGCASHGSGSPVVPSLSQVSAQAAASHGTGSRATALHAAAQCIRQHGVPSYADPVLTPSGQVYSDSRSIEDAGQATIDAVRQACGTLMAQADLNPENEPPAPPQLVQAGVRAAGCMRAHGLPNVQDPTTASPYTPGHGFGMTASEIPPGGKTNPVYQRAAHACRPLLDAEIRASTLASLGDDG